ncbi:S41 family peptidase [Natranaerofaba carboxydovora]|uniref:S41 family peptidase n=1 Tax=Natranaerofaba carboxydovora TaxID=2742683 RepID=UPI001F12B558|nr:S41 family peptidase [Natranaerofaba carboxydovora]UMZ74934.1 putative CtpA-like serine protease [Natranaerofaba carboxydovora]
MRAKKIILVLVLLIVTNLFTFGATKLIFGNIAAGGMSGFMSAPDNSADDVELFKEILGVLESDYYEEVNREELIEGALDGLFEKLDDPQTGYMTPSDLESMMIQTEGSYSGIGIEVYQDGDYVKVLAPIAGTPGDDVGLESGDRIVKVDDEDVVGKDLDEVVNMIRGPEGSEVEVKAERQVAYDEVEEHSFVIERKEIEMSSVEHDYLEDRYGYVQIKNFTGTTAGELETTLDELLDNEVEGMVLDLRNNPGGLLDAAIEVGELLVPEGPIVHVMGRDEKLKSYESDGGIFDKPIVVLVNEVSASASEILAGALQDTGAATIVGTETFGKASVQNVMHLKHGGGLRYTMGRYQTPDGTDIHEKGLTPDVKMDSPKSFQLGEEPITEDLSYGDEGEMVKTLQSILEFLDYYEGEVDGNFDTETEDALKSFQRDSGIIEDGVANNRVMIELQNKLDDLRDEDDEFMEKAMEILTGKVD